MIQQESKALASKLEQYERLKQSKIQAQQLEPVRKQLNEVGQGLLAAANYLSVMQSKCDAPTFSATLTRGFSEKLAAVQQRVATAPTEICGGRDLAGLVKSAEEVTKQLKKLSDEAWNRYVRTARPRVDDAELLRYERSAKYRVIARQVRDLRDAALNVQMPNSASAFDAAVEVFKKLRNALEQLPRRSDDPEVRAFQSAADSEIGAALDLLTDKVRRYLGDNGLDDDYRIHRR